MAEPDFPAAHSMDTMLFAVDADGHLGIFESGEDGAVPKPIESESQEAVRFIERLATEAGMLLWEQGAIRDRHFADGEGYPFGVVMFLRSVPAYLAVFRELDDAFTTWHVGSPLALPEPLTPVFASYLPDEDYRKIHERGLCAGCLSCDSLKQVVRLGVVQFDNDKYGRPPYRAE